MHISLVAWAKQRLPRRFRAEIDVWVMPPMRVSDVRDFRCGPRNENYYASALSEIAEHLARNIREQQVQKTRLRTD